MLRWDWNKDIGREVIEYDGKRFEHKIFRGNAWLIFLAVNEDESWRMHNFYIDYAHFKRCQDDYNTFRWTKQIWFYEEALDIPQIAKYVKSAVKNGVSVYFIPKT